jgi:hypothetical protein
MSGDRQKRMKFSSDEENRTYFEEQWMKLFDADYFSLQKTVDAEDPMPFMFRATLQSASKQFQAMTARYREAREKELKQEADLALKDKQIEDLRATVESHAMELCSLAADNKFLAATLETTKTKLAAEKAENVALRMSQAGDGKGDEQRAEPDPQAVAKPYPCTCFDSVECDNCHMARLDRPWSPAPLPPSDTEEEDEQNTCALIV